MHIIFMHTCEIHQENYILYHKKPSKFQSLEIIQSIFSDDNEIKLETQTNRYKENLQIFQNLVTFLNKPWIKDKITEKIRKYYN